MSQRYWCTGLLLAALAACSGSDPATGQTDVDPLLASSAAQPPALDPAFAAFVDPETGWALQEVRDADREIVRFDLQQQAMVSGASGDAVSGWTTDGNDLRWSRGGAFRVRFGSEAGERRAYFTETGPGTICDLSIRGPDQLSISATDETPPGS